MYLIQSKNGIIMNVGVSVKNKIMGVLVKIIICGILVSVIVNAIIHINLTNI